MSFHAPKTVLAHAAWALGIGLIPGVVLAQADAPRASLTINVREEPDLGSLIVAVLDKGDPVTVLGEQGDFVRLRTRAGTEGFLKHKYLLDYRPGQAVTQPVPAVTAAPVELYRSPYPAEPLVGSPARATRSAVPPPPMTFLTTGAGSGLQLTFGAGSLLVSQDREDLRRDLAREGYGGQVDKLERAAPAAFLRVGYGMGGPWQVEVAVSYLDDVDVHLDSAALTPITLAQSVEDHAPATGFGISPTLAHRWQWPGQALTLRGGGYFSLGNESHVRLNGRPLAVDYQTHSWVAGLAWETQWGSGVWGGLELQVMDLNEPVGLVAMTLRWGS